MNSNQILKKFSFLTLFYSLLITFQLQAQNAKINNFEIIDSLPIKHVCKLPPTNINAHFFVRSNEEVLSRIKSKAQSNFEVDYFSSCGGEEWPQQAVTAFDFALSIWSEHISSDVPIKVNANWIELEGNTLGSAKPTRIVQVNNNQTVNHTWYTLAQLSALTGQAIREQLTDDEGNPIEYDIDMNVQCDFDDWYFGTDANVPENKSDFVTVALHEIGHGLGFLGTMTADTDTDTDIAEWGIGNDDVDPLIYDRFTVDGNDDNLISTSTYPNPSSELYSALTGNRGGIFFEGTDANRTLSGQGPDRAKLYSPNPFDEGSSYSHFDQATFRQSINALMLPFIDRTFAVHTPGPLFCGVLSDMGWPLGEACISFIPSAILVTNQSELNFGVLNSGETAEQTLIISNRDDAESLLAGSVQVNSDQFSIKGDNNFSLEPGESQDVTVVYTPTQDDRNQATLSISHDASNVPSPLMVPIEGESLRSGKIVELDQSYPNPFVVDNSFNTDKPTIEFAISERSHVTLDLFSVSGQYLQPIVDADLDPRRYAESIDMTGLSSGIYIYRIVVDGVAKSGKLMYVN